MNLTRLFIILFFSGTFCHGGTANPPLAQLTLERAWALAEQSHPALASARAANEAAQARLEQSGKLANPELIANVESASFQGRNSDGAEYLAGVSQEIPLSNRRSLERAGSQQEVAAEAARGQARWLEVRQGVHAAFATALYQERALALQSEIRENLAKTATLARARQSAGDAIPEEVARVEMQLALAEVEWQRAQSLRAQSILSLAAAIGNPALSIQSLDGKLEAALEIPTLEVLEEKIQSHPLLRAAQAEVAARQTRIQLAEARRIPDIKVELLYRRVAAEERNGVDVGVSLPLPLFQGNRAKVREARAERAASQARSQEQYVQLQEELRVAQAQLRSALERSRGIEKELLPRAQVVLKTAEARYEAGDISLNDILPLRREAVNLQAAYLEALRETMVAWARLQPFIQK